MGTVVGSGENGEGFAVSIDAGTSSLLVAALIQQMNYRNTSDSPTTNRTMTTVIEDGLGNDVSLNTVITVYAENDAPVITAPATVSLTETAATTASATPLTSSGTLAFTDPDLTDVGHTATRTVAATGTTSGPGDNATLLGYLTLNTVTKAARATAGTVAYDFSAEDQAFDYLAAGETVTVNDGDGGTDSDTITVTVTGTNDAPVLAAVTGETIPDTAADDIFSNRPGSLVRTDADTSNIKTYGITGGGAGSDTIGDVTYDTTRAWTYGTLWLNSATGAYVYVPDDAAIEARTANATDSFTFTLTDGIGTVNQNFTVSITGVNDAAVITDDTTGAVTEAGGVSNGTAGTPTATGNLASTDHDGTADLFTAQSSTPSTGGYGTYVVNTAGVWTYTLNNNNVLVQGLAVGDSLYDTITVTTADGTSRTVELTINGADDAAVISGDTTGAVTEAGGALNATPGSPTATGTLTAADVDGVDNSFTTVASATASTGGYGTYTVTAGGA